MASYFGSTRIWRFGHGVAHSLVETSNLETVPDLRGFAAANGLEGKNDDKIRAAMGDKFPKHIYHSIVCIPSRALTLLG